MVRRGHLIALVVTFLIGCAVLLVVGCAGTRSESPKQQGHTEATREQTRSDKAASEEARCAERRLIDHLIGGLGSDVIYGGPGNDSLKGSTWDGRDRATSKDVLYGGPGNDVLEDGAGDDVLYGGDGDDALYAGRGEDVLYGGDGKDLLIGDEDGQRDKLYCGKGKDHYHAGKNDYVDSSCEKKVPVGGEA